MDNDFEFDLFNDKNIYYKNAHDLPNMSPISWKYTESERYNQKSKRDFPNNKPSRKYQNFERYEEKKEVFKEIIL